MQNKTLFLAALSIGLVAFGGCETSDPTGNTSRVDTLYVYSVRPDSLVLWLPLDGSANDSSGKDNNGVLNGPVTTGDRFGSANSAYFFDGVDDFIDCGADSSLNLTGDFSISLWLKPETWTHANFPGIITQDDAGASEDWTVYYDRTTSALRLTVGAAENAVMVFDATNTAVGLQSWHHLCITRKGDVWLLYLDGAQIASKTSSYTMTGGDRLRIGMLRGNQTDNMFHGAIDDVRIYRRALSKVEVELLFYDKGWGE